MIGILVIVVVLNVVCIECFDSALLGIDSYSKFAEKIKKGPLSLSGECGIDLLKYVDGLLAEETWALQMFDSGSKPPPGLLKGRLTDLGSFDQCLSVSDNSNTIFGKYCIGTIPMKLKHTHDEDNLVKTFLQTIKSNRIETPDEKKGIQLATCMPHSCSAEQIGAILSTVGLNMKFNEELCQTRNTQIELDKTAVIALTFFSVVLVIMLVSTAYDVVLYYLQKKPANQLFTAFSVYTNGRYLLALSKNSSQIGCLHGIRVISTMWIIIRHRYSIQSSFLTNDYFYKAKWQNTEANMYMINAATAVDTFFLLGGLLISYNYLTYEKTGKKFNLILYYIHRYVRLTPVIIALIIFYVALLRHVGSGPLWPRYIEHDLVIGCETYWWKTLLYIQNIEEQSSMCIPHSWYLCVDMQLFVLSPILLLPLKRWPKLTIVFTGFLAVCSAISGFIVSWIFELNIIQSANRTPEKVSQYIHYYYFSTSVRAAPWLIGIILGYLISKFKDKDTKVVYNKGGIIILWLLSIATICACVLAGHDLIVEYEKTGSSLHMALVKSSWAIGISWVIYACVCGYGGPVNWFLSLPIFEVLSKLTYTLYLVHYALIYILVLQMRETTTIGDLQAMHAFWGDFSFTLAASAVIMLSFELPMITVERVLLRRWESEYINFSWVEVGEIAALLLKSQARGSQSV